MARSYPGGRVGPDDDGETEFAIVTDVRHKIIKIQFQVPMLWFGMPLEGAMQFRDLLDKHIGNLTQLEEAVETAGECPICEAACYELSSGVVVCANGHGGIEPVMPF